MSLLICRTVLAIVTLIAAFQALKELKYKRQGTVVVCLCATLIAFIAFCISMH